MATNIGGPNDNVIIGKSFKDKLFGNGGDDKLYGNGGNDVIKGGSGDDLIVGGRGDDKLTGGTGSDTFVFKQDSGKDIVTDFDVKKDVLEIARGLNGIKKAGDVLDHASQKGKDVIINLGDGNKITLKNVDLDDLKKHPGDHFDIV
ncbi:MAG: hemolysin-type calcium-binding protein [Rhizobium sp.]|nr:hemolysin-type calcium-binding protein [Rhizobium sp.]